LTDGRQGLELVRILEASSKSLKRGGVSVNLSGQENGNGWMPLIPERTPEFAGFPVTSL
jgi:hypothetical protein